MGITIHYRLQAPELGTDVARRLVRALHEHARHLPVRSVGDVVELGDPAQAPLEQDPYHAFLRTQSHQLAQRGPRLYRVRPTQMIGFAIEPGPGCEPASFGLCRYPAVLPTERRGRLATHLDEGWHWRTFCKTHYAANPDAGGTANFVRCHRAVIRLLDQCQSLGVLASVEDEGGYWSRRDPAALVRALDR